MTTAPAAHAQAYQAAPSVNWLRPLALAGALAFSAVVWVGIGWVVLNLL